MRVAVKKALNLACTISTNKRHGDLEFDFKMEYREPYFYSDLGGVLSHA